MKINGNAFLNNGSKALSLFRYSDFASSDRVRPDQQAQVLKRPIEDHIISAVLGMAMARSFLLLVRGCRERKGEAKALAM
jgi:hypothetical protein